MNLPDRAQTFTITGIVTFGSDDNLAGVTLAGFDLQTAQALFNSRGHYDTINVLAAPGADNVKLQLAIARLLPPGVEVVSGQTVANELSSAVDNALGVHLDGAADLRGDRAVRRRLHDLQHVLDHRRPADARAGAAARRRREPPAGVPLGARRGRADRAGRLADRAGARRPAALGLKALLKAFGIALPSAPLVFEARTVIVAVAVGVGVTVLSAILPARRAVRIPPVAALVEHSDEAPESLRRRGVIAGAAFAVAGVAVLAGRAGQAGGRRWSASARCGVHRGRHARPRARAAAVGRARAPAAPPCSACPAGSAGRTRCAARAGPRRPRPR